MRSTNRQALATFIVAAGVTFAVLKGRNAKANTIYTVPGLACLPYSTNGRICPIAGGAPLANGLSTVYFDFRSSGTNKVITSAVWRQTTSGTLVLANNANVFSAGVHETSVSCTTLNPGRSGWDYYFAAVTGESGANLDVGSNVFGIGVWAL